MNQIPTLQEQLWPGFVLAIESSCDETAAAVLSGSKVLSNCVSSQISLHTLTGGVVPEVAARAHIEALLPILNEALLRAGITYPEITAVAVTNRPGLVGCLSVGVSAAKALALALGIPLLGVHHLEGHVLSPLFADENLPFPHVALLVSGGHTELLLVRGLGEYEMLGSTIDDAAGEAFDKSARLLGLPYPGGKALSDLAKLGDARAFRLPRGLEGKETHDFSFSGLKTAVRRLIESTNSSESASIAASVQEAICSVLAERTLRAAESIGVATITLSGGVAANSRLRELLSHGTDRLGMGFVAAPLEFCSDNAAMIGLAGSYRLARGERDGKGLDCYASAPNPGARSQS